MYTSFLFLLLVFLIPNISDGNQFPWIQSPGWTFTLAHVLYAGVLGIIYLLGRSARRSYKQQSKFLLSTELLLIGYLTFSFFGLQIERFFNTYSDFQVLPTLWSLLLYLGGLWVFYTQHYHARKASNQIRFLLPFALPFLLFTCVLDLFFSASNPFFNESNTILFTITGFAVAGFILVFFPLILQAIWQCKPLASINPELSERLEAICKKAHFKHAGIKVWTVMNDSLTAAIIGIVPRFRYIIFTKKLLQLLSPESIEAVLAHEIGHSYRKHLIIYPFIILGMTACLTWFSYQFEESLPPFVFFLLYAAIIALYLRVVFGFFSRNFERQADLHVFELDIQPKHMIDALHQVAVASGNIHLVPSWHHFSIQERIDFLNDTIRDPDLIKKHHRFVKIAVAVYFILLISLLGWFLWI